MVEEIFRALLHQVCIFVVDQRKVLKVNARKYRIKLNLSPLDFPAIDGLGEYTDFTKTEPPTVVDDKLILKITKKFILVETFTKEAHDILTAQSVYEVPLKSIETSEDVYKFYLDATLGLSEAYQFVQRQTSLPVLTFPSQSIANYQKEIDAVFRLISSLN